MKNVGLTVLVDVEGGSDLIPVTLWDFENDSVIDIAKKLNEKVMRAKTNKDKDHSESTQLFSILPTFVLGVFMGVFSYIS